jgi:hypothetical protein
MVLFANRAIQDLSQLIEKGELDEFIGGLPENG